MTPDLTAKLFTEQQLFAPNIDWQLTKWWHHRLILEYDSRSIRSTAPPTMTPSPAQPRATSDRYQLDYQNDIVVYPLADPDDRVRSMKTISFTSTSRWYLRPMVTIRVTSKTFTDNAAGFR